MNTKFKWSGLVGLLAFFGLASGTASATPIDFSFHNTGTVDTDYCSWDCGVMHTEGELKIFGVTFGTFTGTLNVVGLGHADVLDTSTWQFVDTSGSNSLSGTLSGDLWGLIGLIGTGSLDYIVDQGTGVFSGATGSGWSTYSFSPDFFRQVVSYDERGQMHVDVGSVRIPEPAVSTLLLAALAGAGMLAYRRRRASTQI